ncbi:hypothetical protein AMS68_005523 [Peltaster fructicola]|uniref:FHA domain-containing protein n=1 Tax=Peltaster fructicola TaxID=286661 RepID=A0A6H0XZA4_9PEZI|nr:hypothetical protein AMS68_005523 [Peltaster fructicola]
MNYTRASKWGPAPINFTLTSSDLEDGPRKLRLNDAPIKVGRASKTETRGALALSTNALFECPVISREHAEFAFDHKQEQVTITDRGSMHGTFVNGRQLDKGLPFTLQDHDIIQLGTLVHRGHAGESYKPVSVVFKKNKAWSRAPDAQSTYEVPLATDEESDYGTDGESCYVKPVTSNLTTPESKKDFGSQLKPIDVESWTVDTPGDVQSWTVQPPCKVLHNTQEIEEMHPDSADTITSSITALHKDDTISLFDQEAAEEAESIASCNSANWHLQDLNTYHEDNDNNNNDELRSDDALDTEAQKLSFESLADTHQTGDQPDATADGTTREEVNAISTAPQVDPLTHSSRPRRSRAFPQDQLRFVHCSGPFGRPSSFRPPPPFNDMLDSSVRKTTAMHFPPPNLPPRPNPTPVVSWVAPISSTVPPSFHAAPLGGKTLPAPPADSIGTFVRDVTDHTEKVEMSTKDRRSAVQMAIPHILIDDSQASNHTVVQDRATKVDQEESAPASRKRKADAVSIEAGDESTTATQTCAPTETTPQETPQLVLEQRPKKKVKTSQKPKSTFVNDLGKLTLGAALGMTGTFTLLASPLGGMLADWASKL